VIRELASAIRKSYKPILKLPGNYIRVCFSLPSVWSLANLSIQLLRDEKVVTKSDPAYAFIILEKSTRMGRGCARPCERAADLDASNALPQVEPCNASSPVAGNGRALTVGH
jgi:hypothetical protein